METQRPGEMTKCKPQFSLLFPLVLLLFSCNTTPKPAAKSADDQESAATATVSDSSSAEVSVIEGSASEADGEDSETVSGIVALDWPQWLGPDRTGISKETGFRKTFPKNGPKILWKKSLGAGFSAFSVVKDRAYTMFADDSYEYLVCLNANTGKEIWKTRTDLFYGDYMGGNGPRATPTIDGNLVYTLSAYGKLYAVDASTGSVVWEQDFKKSFGAKPPQWGFCGSPLVADGRVYIETGGENGNHVVAYNKTDGKLVWKTVTGSDDVAGYSSPIKTTINDVPQILFFTGRGVMGTNPENGTTYWRYPWKTDYDVNAATPVFVAPDGILISSGYGTGSALLRIAGSGGNQQASEVWKNRDLKSRMATPVLYEGYLYGFDASILKCIEAKTGKEMWKHRGYGEGSLIIADGMLIVLGDKGNLGMARISPKGFTELATAQVLDGNKGWTGPALSGGRLFVRNLYEMACVDLR